MKRASVIIAAMGVALAAASITTASDWWKPSLGKSDESEKDSGDSRSSKPSAIAPVHFDDDDDAKSSRSSKRSTFSTSRSYSKEPEPPSTWQKVKGNTGRFVTKSKQTLMPWTKPKAPRNESVTGVRRVYYPTQKPKKEEKGFFSWFKGEEEKEEPKTVLDWLDQPRPD